MAECTVCGKNGLFLFVNNAGRCKSCEAAYREEQNKLRRIEEERLALLEKEKKEKEKIQIAEAREKVIEIFDLMVLLSNEYVISPSYYEELLLIMDEHIKQSHDLWSYMIKKADENPFFCSELKKFAFSKDLPLKYSVVGSVRFSIWHAFAYGEEDPHLAAINCLESRGQDFEEKWKKEKKKIERCIEKKAQKAKCKATNERDNSKAILSGENQGTVGKSISADENILIEKYSLLNDEGRSKACEHVEMLTKISEYKRKDCK